MALKFDISWNYSWRKSAAPSNWDAMWVFAKFRKNLGEWQHVTLTDSGHTAPATATIDIGLRDPTSAYNLTTNRGVGAFIYKSSAGFGTNTFNGVKLVWPYTQDGVQQGDRVDIQLHAIHMVYVLGGNFSVGDTNTSTSSFKQQSSSNSVTIAGEGEVTVYEGATGYTVPAAFPKGHNDFYIMRHELNQEQWRNFFNSLPTTGNSRTNRDITSSTGKNSDALVDRNNLSWDSSNSANVVTIPDRDSPNGATYCSVPVNYLSWEDFTAYLDWAGLRPMTELEFEKAARGPTTPVNGEYSWGTTSGTNATGVTNGGRVTEVPASEGENVNWSGGVSGPLRNGSFASINYGLASRGYSGGSYYGAMELSGNVWERVVTVANSNGRAFTGAHGDGALDSNGGANVTNWPDPSTATGSGLRGGSWNVASTAARVSDRSSAASTSTTRASDYGGRGVRTAPSIAAAFLVSPPSAVSTERTLNSAVSGDGVVEWRYALGEGTYDCDGSPQWSSWTAVANSLSLDLGYPRQKVLCLQGRDQANGIVGPVRAYTWFLAYENDIQLSTIENVSLDAPLIQAVNDTTDTRSRFSDSCIDTRANSSVTVGSTIYFLTICNSSSVGWGACLAEWDSTASSVTWTDAAPNTAGFQAHWHRCSLSSNGSTYVGNLWRYTLTAISDGSIYGTFNGSGPGCTPTLQNSGFYPVMANSFGALASSSTLSATHNWAQPISAGTWRESYDRFGSWVNADEDDDIWIYNTSKDSDGRFYFWGVEKPSNDYTSSSSAPAQYWVADYRIGMVRSKGSTYHFIGYHTDRQRWEHVLGKSPSDFDWDHPTDLNLSSLLSVSGKWFSDNAVTASGCTTGGPYIHTFEVHTNSQNETNLFIFYRAGDLTTRTATTVRGIGAIKIALGNTIQP